MEYNEIMESLWNNVNIKGEVSKNLIQIVLDAQSTVPQIYCNRKYCCGRVL